MILFNIALFAPFAVKRAHQPLTKRSSAVASAEMPFHTRIEDQHVRNSLSSLSGKHEGKSARYSYCKYISILWSGFHKLKFHKWPMFSPDVYSFHIICKLRPAFWLYLRIPCIGHPRLTENCCHVMRSYSLKLCMLCRCWCSATNFSCLSPWHTRYGLPAIVSEHAGCQSLSAKVSHNLDQFSRFKMIQTSTRFAYKCTIKKITSHQHGQHIPTECCNNLQCYFQWYSHCQLKGYSWLRPLTGPLQWMAGNHAPAPATKPEAKQASARVDARVKRQTFHTKQNKQNIPYT